MSDILLAVVKIEASSSQRLKILFQRDCPLAEGGRQNYIHRQLFALLFSLLVPPVTLAKMES